MASRYSNLIAARAPRAVRSLASSALSVSSLNLGDFTICTTKDSVLFWYILNSLTASSFSV